MLSICDIGLFDVSDTAVGIRRRPPDSGVRSNPRHKNTPRGRRRDRRSHSHRGKQLQLEEYDVRVIFSKLIYVVIDCRNVGTGQNYGLVSRNRPVSVRVSWLLF